MNTTFDPYQAWLGIPSTEQPPHHYRLLKLNLWEHRWDLIDAAGDRQMTIVRAHESGETAALAKQLSIEIAAAKVCLLNPKQKAVYDAQLRQRLVDAGQSLSDNCGACCTASTRKKAGYVGAALAIAVLIAIVYCVMYCRATPTVRPQGNSASPDLTTPRTAVSVSHHPS